METLTSVCLPKEHSSMMDEDYPGLSLGLFYEQSLTDSTWTQHSEKPHKHVIRNCNMKPFYEGNFQDMTFSHQITCMTHIPLLKINQSLGHLQAKKKKKEESTIQN